MPFSCNKKKRYKKKVCIVKNVGKKFALYWENTTPFY